MDVFISIERVSLRFIFYVLLAASCGIREGSLQPDSMADDNSVGGGHAYDEARGMEVMRARLLTQETALRGLEDSVERRFQVFERRFDEIADRLDALALDANRDRVDDRRRPRADNAQGQPINRPVPAHHRRQPVYSDDSEEEDFLFGNHQPARGGGRYVRDYERDRGNFRFKVDIPYFHGNLNMEDFIEWLAEVDKFFDYMEVPEEKRVRLVACRLKGGASARWERL